MNLIIYSSCLIFLTFCFTNSAKSQAKIDIESGLVLTGYNDVRIPGNQGSFFSLKDNLQPKEKVFFRLRASYTFKTRHTISALYAPLKIKSDGNVAHDIVFQGEVFPANNKLNGTYKFNSYRLTYRYDIINNSRIIFGLGFTAKIRDARISLSSPDLYAEKTNVGFVPIINFRLFWKANDKFGLLLDGDALAAPQGRAEDILIAVNHKLSEKFDIRAGYRILEGGADNDEVYNFALFHYVSFGISYTLNH